MGSFLINKESPLSLKTLDFLALANPLRGVLCPRRGSQREREIICPSSLLCSESSPEALPGENKDKVPCTEPGEQTDRSLVFILQGKKFAAS